MKPGFCLNQHDRNLNPLFESHDPSMMWDPIGKKYYSYATDSAITSDYKQGIPVRVSNDLVQFQYVGTALSEEAIKEGRNNGEFPETPGFWAPYVEYDSGEYRMYYSATKAFGSSESRIWLAVSKKPEGPFENRGVVADTWFTTDNEPNAIDPHIIHDEQNERYLVYGSFFGGIYIKSLDAQGMPKDGNAKTLGTCIAKKPIDSYIDGPEGPAIIYVPKTQYYYLFISYGWLGDTYDIRVGRSKQVCGPYVDTEGKNLVEESLGLKLAGSYCFQAQNPYAVRLKKGEKETGREGRLPTSVSEWEFGGFRGPGHGVPFYTPEYPLTNGKQSGYFFVHHVRDGASCLKHEATRPGEQTSYISHYMAVRQMGFVKDWPVFMPEPFALEEKISREELSLKRVSSILNIKEYEWIVYSQTNNEMIDSKTASSCEEYEDAIGVLSKAYDFENQKEVYCFTGFTKDMNTIWCKCKIE